MREVVNRQSLYRFMRELGHEARKEARVYLTGGASAVLYGWRDSTIDIDLEIIPESDEVLRAIPRLKEELRINVELASPSQFIPELPAWQERSPFIRREGRLAFHHYDFYAQALSKIERGHARDISDVREMHRRGLIDAGRLTEFHEAIGPQLYRYPAIDPRTFREAVKSFIASIRQ